MKTNEPMHIINSNKENSVKNTLPNEFSNSMNIQKHTNLHKIKQHQYFVQNILHFHQWMKPIFCWSDMSKTMRKNVEKTKSSVQQFLTTASTNHKFFEKNLFFSIHLKIHCLWSKVHFDLLFQWILQFSHHKAL